MDGALVKAGSWRNLRLSPCYKGGDGAFGREILQTHTMIKTNITKWLRIFLQYVGLYLTCERQGMTEEMVLIQGVGRGMSTDCDVYSGMDF